MNRSGGGQRTNQYGWADCPPACRSQVLALVAQWRGLLGGNLSGIYLHGSLAMGCFNPLSSDIDLLVLTANPLPAGTKSRLVDGLLHLSRQPSPVEVSFLARDDLHPWRFPTPYQLHFSESWRERFEQAGQRSNWIAWQATRADPDLAAHLTVTRARGVVLEGAAIGGAFPAVPPQDYLDAILKDVDEASRDITMNPIYAVLNLCRVCAYVESGQIVSKDEGGEWALKVLPAAYRPFVRQALAAYRGEQSPVAWDAARLVEFAGEVLVRIHAHLQ